MSTTKRNSKRSSAHVAKRTAKRRPAKRPIRAASSSSRRATPAQLEAKREARRLARLPRTLTYAARVYPALLRARVLTAILCCPACTMPVRYRARTSYTFRCPWPGCGEVWSVGLILRKPVRSGPAGRPPDTIVPGGVFDVADAGAVPEADEVRAADVQIDAIPRAELDPAWEPGEPVNALIIEQTQTQTRAGKT